MSPPPYVAGVFEGVFAVRWRLFTLQALGKLRAEIAKARRLLGRRLVYLSLIPASPHDFSEAERKVLASFVKELLVHDCDSIHHVIAGAGFAASARLSIVTALALAATRPEAFHTHASLEAALVAIAAETAQPADRLMAEAAGAASPSPERHFPSSVCIWVIARPPLVRRSPCSRP